MKSKIARIACVLLLSSAAPAVAQTINPSEDVEQRAHPEYDPLGIRVGSFTLMPSVAARSFVTDNYRATRTNRKSDIGLLLRPELTWRSGWLRHKVDGNVYVQQTLNTPLSKENSLTYGGRVSGVLEASRDTEARLDLSARRDVEDRRYIGSFNGTVEPIYFTALRATASATHRFGDMSLGVNGDVEQLKFGDATLADGTKFRQDFRDYRTTSFGGNGTYGFNNGISLELAATHSNTDYFFGPGDPGFIPGVSFDRRSKSDTITGGVRLELSSLIYGTLRAGYMHYDVRDPRISDVSGFTYEGNILWNVSTLTSLVFSARRWVNPAGSTQASGIVRNDFRFEAHHELYRNVLLTLRSQAIRFRSLGENNRGMEYHLNLGARYKMNRNWSLTAAMDYAKRTSKNSLDEFHALEGSLGLRYAL